ncbi:YitT family protein [Erysipelothrix rhusiopathiae]|nr:YitT family protein [Erysipelothrix rhusiopathiae]RNM29094.1 YitT family protein [Erysipelothrix rhusiopathiae]
MINMENLRLIKPKHIVGIVVGALFSALAIKTFVRPGNLIPAGAGGLTILLLKESSRLFGIELSYGIVFFLINAIVLIFVWKKLGRRFLALSFLHVGLVSLFVEILPVVTVLPNVDPNDQLILLAIFGGVMNGVGSSFALKVGGSAGGIDFVAIYYSMVKNKPMGDKIMYFNITLLIYSGFVYGWMLALYSIIYQFVSTQVIDHYHDRYKLSSLHIITDLPTEVSDAVMAVTRHGITKIDGIGMFKQKYKAVLYIVVNQFELACIIDAITHTDPKAFIEISSVERIEGNYRQKPLE